MSLPVFADAEVANLNFAEGASRERCNALMSSLSKTKYGISNKSTYLSWAKYFVDDNGKNSPYQLDAFLAY